MREGYRLEHFVGTQRRRWFAWATTSSAAARTAPRRDRHQVARLTVTATGGDPSARVFENRAYHSRRRREISPEGRHDRQPGRLGTLASDDTVSPEGQTP